MKQDLANWTNYPVLNAHLLEASFTEDVTKHVQKNDSLIARGNGRCYGDASLDDTVLSCLRLDNILMFDEVQGLIHVQSGVLLEKILKLIVPHGWFIPVTPGTKFVSVGGAIASNVHGKNHHKEGSFSNFVEEIELVNAAGEKETFTRASDPLLFDSTCGGMGLTGIILSCKIRLKKIETSFIDQKSIRTKNLTETMNVFENNMHYTYSMAWIDTLQSKDNLGRGIVMLGEHASKTSHEKDKFTNEIKPHITIPFNFPTWILNKLTIKSFNWLYYRKHVRKVLTRKIHYDKFFYPLDSILHWNRMYGYKGFVQYQAVIPLDNSYSGIAALLEKIGSSQFGSFLAVLKLMGDEDNYISFPQKGYTLALDFPLRKGLFEFLEELDSIVGHYGGRLYLSKDARMSPQFFKATYDFKKINQELLKVNPSRKFRSSLSKRIKLI